MSFQLSVFRRCQLRTGHCSLKTEDDNWQLRRRAWGEDGFFCLRAGEAPSCATMVGIGEELEGAAAGGALEVVFDFFAGPLGVEQVGERAGAFGDVHCAPIDCIQKTASEFEIVPWLVEADGLFELFALRAERHGMSLPPSTMRGSHAEGATVMVSKRHTRCRGEDRVGRC